MIKYHLIATIQQPKKKSKQYRLLNTVNGSIKTYNKESIIAGLMTNSICIDNAVLDNNMDLIVINTAY